MRGWAWVLFCIALLLLSLNATPVAAPTQGGDGGSDGGWCGDGICNEASAGCCDDCGCTGDLTCVNNVCQSPTAPDSDGDGVAYDQCPNTPAGEAVNRDTGCSCSQITCGTYKCGTDTACATYPTKTFSCSSGVCSQSQTCTASDVTYKSGSCSLGDRTGTCSNGQCVACPVSSTNPCMDTCGNQLSGTCGGSGTCQAGACNCGTGKTLNPQTGSCQLSCTPACPDPTTVACGTQITPTNSCGQCTGTGTKCADGYTCSNNQCVCTPKPASVACAGVQCGSVSNGCGGTIQCDNQCTLHQTCQNNACACQNQCTQGQKMCTTEGAKTCVQAGSCWVWSSPRACQYGCSGNECCTITGWTPSTENTCFNQNVTQTSNCGTTRTLAGAKQTAWANWTQCSGCTPTCTAGCQGTQTRADLNACQAAQLTNCTIPQLTGLVCDTTCRTQGCTNTSTTTTETRECSTIQVKVTNPYNCNTASGSCVAGTPVTSITVTGTIPQGTACTNTTTGLAGTCQGASCVPHACNTNSDCQADACSTASCVNHECVKTPKLDDIICKDVSDGGAVDWSKQFATCSGTAAVCGKTCTRPVIGQSCTGAADGICVGSGDCRTECPIRYPGCLAKAEANMAATSYGCRQQGYGCFECSQGYVYDTGAQGCVASSYSLSFSSPSAKAGQEFTITPVLRGANDQVLSNSDHNVLYTLDTANIHRESYDVFKLAINDPGEYAVSITATQSRTGRVLDTETGTITVACNDACCQGSAPSPDGTACTKDGAQGTCQDKRCVTACTPSASLETADLCNNGRDDDCNGVHDCADPSCGCQIRCSQEEVVCGSACTDTRSSNRHCGACNVACDNTEQCVQGVCKQSCTVACAKDADCRTGEICMGATTCESYCAPTTAMLATEEQISRLTQEIGSTKTYSVRRELRGRQIIVTVDNLAPVPLRNVSVVVNINFPKHVVASASELSADHPFSVIQDDPIIEFTFPEVKSEQRIAIELPREADEALIQSVIVGVQHATVNEQPAILTPEQATITRDYVTKDGKTTLVIGIDPHMSLEGVRIPIEIPKCLLESAAAMNATGAGKYEIIKDDPLVVWKLERVTSSETLEIEVGDADEECKDGLTAFAVADTARRPSSPWLPLLIIPIIGVIIVFFQRFHAQSGAEEQLSRAEFERIAKEEGTPPEQMEQAWKEYQSRW